MHGRPHLRQRFALQGDPGQRLRCGEPVPRRPSLRRRCLLRLGVRGRVPVVFGERQGPRGRRRLRRCSGRREPAGPVRAPPQLSQVLRRRWTVQWQGRLPDGRAKLAGTVCGSAWCANGTITGQICNGGGKCSDSSESCGAFKCNEQATACRTDCEKNGDCAADAYCDLTSSKCKSKSASGDPCTTGVQCSTGYCFDGVCCNQPCGGQCKACNEPGNPGACVPVTGEPRGSRAKCAGAAGEPCQGQCDGGDTTACAYPGSAKACGPAASCEGDVAQPRGACDGTGSCATPGTKSCVPYGCEPATGACRTSCTSDGDCAQGSSCDAVTAKSAITTAKCVDGFTLQEADGTIVVCAPYKCLAGGCQQQCLADGDCAPGHSCVGAQCLASETSSSTSGSSSSGGGASNGPTATSSSAASSGGADSVGGADAGSPGGPAADAGGCGCRMQRPRDVGWAWVALGGLAAALVSRGRRFRRVSSARPSRASAAPESADETQSMSC